MIWLLLACTHICRDAAACLDDGHALELREEFQGAQDAYVRACELGSASGCANAGHMWLDGTLPTDVTRGVAYYDKACAAMRSPEACHSEGSLLMTLSPDASRAAFKTGCELHDADSCVQYGRSLLKDPSHRAEALAILTPLVPDSIEAAEAVMRALMKPSDGSPKDYAGALAIAAPLCEERRPVFCEGAGLAYYNIDSPIRDFSLAWKYFVRECDAKEVRGCFFAAESGLYPESGVPPEEVAAMLRRACTLGRAEGCGELGNMSLKSYGGLTPADAPVPLKTACDAGLKLACELLAP